MKIIPKDISQLYKGAGLKTNAYVRLRWSLCPFERIERFVPKGGLILDLGCGRGMLTNFLAIKEPARQVLGVDGSAERILAAQVSLKKDNLKFVEADIDKWELPICQAAVMTDFLHHLPAEVASRLLVRVFNALESGGCLVLQEVSRKPYLKYLTTITIDRILNLGKDLNYQPISYWQALLEKIGYKVEVRPAHQGLPLADVIFIGTKS